MPTDYTIYVVNQSADQQTFWCFLGYPQTLQANSEVFANSSACIPISSLSSDYNYFTIPLQYIIGAGSSQQAAGLGVSVTSSTTQDVNLGDGWNAVYADFATQGGLGPTLTQGKSDTNPNMISITTNAFDQVGNQNSNFYSTQSFGVQSSQGFMGFSWSPSPNTITEIEPTPSFYISIGSFSRNSLAQWTTVSATPAVISTATSTDTTFTVTLTSENTWTVSPGKPSAQLSADVAKVFSSKEHLEFAALSYLSTTNTQSDIAKTVHWKAPLPSGAATPAAATISGSVTLATALTAAFAYFVVSGIKFTITKPASGVTSVDFTFDGTTSAKNVKDTLVAGAQLAFGGAPSKG